MLNFDKLFDNIRVKLINIRCEKNFSQTELSKLINISQQRISYYESGRKKIDLFFLLSCLHVYNISIYDFFKNLQESE